MRQGGEFVQLVTSVLQQPLSGSMTIWVVPSLYGLFNPDSAVKIYDIEEVEKKERGSEYLG